MRERETYPFTSFPNRGLENLENFCSQGGEIKEGENSYTLLMIHARAPSQSSSCTPQCGRPCYRGPRTCQSPFHRVTVPEQGGNGTGGCMKGLIFGRSTHGNLGVSHGASSKPWSLRCFVNSKLSSCKIVALVTAGGRSCFNSLADRIPEFFMHFSKWQALPPGAAHVSVAVSRNIEF